MRYLVSVSVMMATLMIVGRPLEGQVISAKGTATVRFMDEECLRRDRKPDRCLQVSSLARDEALRRATLNAIERHYAEESAAASTNFESARTKIERAVDDYVLGRLVLSETVDTTRGDLFLVVRVELNRAKLDAVMSPTARGGRVAADRPVIAIVFMARRQASVTGFDAERAERLESERTLQKTRTATRTSTSGQRDASASTGVADSSVTAEERDKRDTTRSDSGTTRVNARSASRTDDGRSAAPARPSGDSAKVAPPAADIRESTATSDSAQSSERQLTAGRSRTLRSDNATKRRTRSAAADTAATAHSDSSDVFDDRTSSRKLTVDQVRSGSVTRRADVVAREVMASVDVNVAMSGVLAQGGYEVADAEFIDAGEGASSLLAKVRSAFADASDLPPAVLRQLAGAARDAGASYLAFGTLDIGIAAQDPVSGLLRIEATVTGKVLDVTGKLPRTIAAVGPVVQAGLGRETADAGAAALRRASEAAGREVVQRLRQRAP